MPKVYAAVAAVMLVVSGCGGGHARYVPPGDADGDDNPCEDVCLTADESRCNGDVLETCSETVEGCLDWAMGEDCGAEEMVCSNNGVGRICMACDRGVWEGDYDVGD